MSLWPPAKDDVKEDGASKGKEKLFDGNCAKEGETQDGSKKACAVEDSIVSDEQQAKICCSHTDPRKPDQQPTNVSSLAFEAGCRSWQSFKKEPRKH